jgi:serine/threonine protein kinase
MAEHEIFLAALDIAHPSQRAAFLEQSCAGDAALRKQVEDLLAAHERSGEFLDVPALQQMADNLQGTARTTTIDGHGEIDLSFLQPSTDPASLGRLLHYEIREVIGRGGFGIVLKALDGKLERVVAIKVMSPELAATSPARKRFLREARAAAAHLRTETRLTFVGGGSPDAGTLTPTAASGGTGHMSAGNST